MPRVAREKSSTGVYHVILRGHNQQPIFKEEEDARRFLHILEKYQKSGDYLVFAYCLMANHVHLLIKEEQAELGTIMKRIGVSFVYWYNQKYERCGNLFQDRFRSEAVEDEQYFLTVLRYIHQNPVKAGLVEELASYNWTSYREYLGELNMIEADYVLGIFHPLREKAVAAFRDFHNTNENVSCLEIVDQKRSYKDDEAVELIKELCSVSCCSELKAAREGELSCHLRLLKEQGLSTRQIARLTGISRRIILKA